MCNQWLHTARQELGVISVRSTQQEQQAAAAAVARVNKGQGDDTAANATTWRGYNVRNDVQGVGKEPLWLVSSSGAA